MSTESTALDDRISVVEGHFRYMKAALQQLTGTVLAPSQYVAIQATPEHPPIIASTQSVLEPSVSGVPESGDLENPVGKYPFLDHPLTYFAALTSNVSGDIRRAANRALTAMTEHNIVSSLPLRTLLRDIYAGTIVPCCAERILVVEVLLRTHHLATESDDEPTSEHVVAEEQLLADPYSHHAVSFHSCTNVSSVPHQVRPLWPAGIHRCPPVPSPADLRRTEHEADVREKYNSMSIKYVNKLILPPFARNLPENTYRRVLRSFRLVVCQILRYGDKTIPNTTTEGMFERNWVPGWEYTLQRFVQHTHDLVKNPPSTYSTFVDTLFDETFASLAEGSTGPEAFNKLLKKLDFEYGCQPTINIPERIQSFTVVQGTTFREYFRGYRSLVTDLMSGDPVHRPSVWLVVTTVRENLHRHFHVLGVLLFTGEAGDNRYFTSLDQLWRHLEKFLYTDVLAGPSPYSRGKSTSLK